MKFARQCTMLFLLWGLISGCVSPSPTTLPDPTTPPLESSTEPIATTDAMSQTYDMNGMAVHLNTTFPQAPASMNIYQVNNETLATVESVRSLAAQFKMNGEIYELNQQSGISGSVLAGDKEYLLVDGNRQLWVRSDKYFSYIPDSVSRNYNLFIPVPSDAEDMVYEFMLEFGFEFPYLPEQAGLYSYAALALSPDGFSLRYGGMQFNGFQFYFDKNGIALVTASLLNYEPTASMEIISAEEAFQKFLNPTDEFGYPQFGYLSSGEGNGFFMVGDKILKQEDFRRWTHVRPFDEMVTLNGSLSSSGRSVNGGPPLILFEGYTVTGNVGDIPENMPWVYVEVQGQFHNVNGVKTFELESWKKSDVYEELISGTLQRDGDQFILEDANGKIYILQDVPDEIPLPMEYAFAHGITRGKVFDWNFIDNTGGGGGGGGGGGPSGFYKINFSGTPVTFPTPTPLPPMPEPVLEPVAALRGSLYVSATVWNDEISKYSFLFLPYDEKIGGVYFFLGGNLDESLAKLQNRPVDLWGKIDSASGQIIVDRYENPFPDLEFQVISGSQRLESVDGQDVTIITADDENKYIVLTATGAPAPVQSTDPVFVPGSNDPSSIPSPNAENFLYEGLIVPGETLYGYQGIRVFHSVPGTINGKPNLLEITSNQPDLLSQPLPPTSMNIEKVELVYFSPDNLYSVVQASDNPIYVQPAWRFYGHYDDGSSFEILIQALKPEYLLPEVDPATGP